MALYCSIVFFFPVSFSQASQPDELTIDEHEMLEVIEDGDMEDWVKVNQSYLGYFSGLTPPAEVYSSSKNRYDCNSRWCTEENNVCVSDLKTRFPQNSNNCYSEILHTSFLNDGCLNSVEIFLGGCWFHMGLFMSLIITFLV